MTVAPHGEQREEERAERESVARQKTAVRLISYAQRQRLTADELVQMADMLELGIELDELAATSPERQRLLAAARARLQLQLTAAVEA